MGQSINDSMSQLKKSWARHVDTLSLDSAPAIVAYSCEKPQLRCRAAPWGGQAGASPGPTSLI